MRILIVDDEPPARRRLRRLLGQLGELAVVGEAGDGLEAKACIESLRPDVVFLDIQMPHLDGLAVAARTLPLPIVVFVTAYDEFAVAAFEVGALDYLLKPVRTERLAITLDRIRQSMAMHIGSMGAPREGQPAAAAFVEELVMASPLPNAARIVCFDQDRFRFFDARLITRFWADQKYTLFLTEGSEQLTAEPLTALEKRLGPFGFMRVHRAELVNLSRVKALLYRDGEAVLQLTDGQEALVSRRRVASVRAQLSSAVHRS